MIVGELRKIGIDVTKATVEKGDTFTLGSELLQSNPGDAHVPPNPLCA
jgi:hypothetical protein